MKTDELVIPVDRHAAPRAMWSSGMKCAWISWTVVDEGILRLDMPADDCCDMRGAIKAAQVLCPLVWRIDTYSGGKLDIVYVKTRGEW